MSDANGHMSGTAVLADAPPAGDHDRKTVRLKLSGRGPVDIPPQPDEDSTVLRPSASVHEEYQILRKIAGGGMGVVYLARDKRLGRHVAIKRLTSENDGLGPMRERFVREARAIAALSHIHIVHVYALGEDADGPYIVMEYVPGPKPDSEGRKPNPPCSLADFVHREGPMPLDAALDLVIKVCRAMIYAHGATVVHRDLKPSNVLIDESNEPKVVDFGLARVTDDSAKPLTLPGEKMLSLGYGAPEQEVDASLADERADVYGLGAVLYYCITGKNPRYFRPNDVPEVLRMPICKALETEREARWDSVDAFMSSLMMIKTPDEFKLSTAKTTWRCKWCDTINPIMIRYCGECGWDGGAVCAECGSEQRFGIQYCGVCGADQKEYEFAHGLMDDLKRHMEEKDFPFVLQKETDIAGFNPRGINGRRLIERVHELGQQAGSALRRRSRLLGEIQNEYAQRNFETVRRHIEEYRQLSVDDRFDDMLAQLDGLTLERDLTRLQSAAKGKQWEYVRRNGQQLLASVGEGNETILTLVKRAGWRLFGAKALRVVGACLIALAVYLMSAAPMYHITRQRTQQGAIFRNVYAVAARFQNESLLGPVMRLYARIWGVSDMFPRETESSD